MNRAVATTIEARCFSVCGSTDRPSMSVVQMKSLQKTFLMEDSIVIVKTAPARRTTLAAVGDTIIMTLGGDDERKKRFCGIW